MALDYNLKIKCTLSLPSASIFIVSKIVDPENGIDIEWGDVTSMEITSADGQVYSFTSVYSICRFLARIFSVGLYGQTMLEKTEVDHWLDFCSRKHEFNDSLTKINNTLSSVTYLVGDAITLADICVWTMLHSNKEFRVYLARAPTTKDRMVHEIPAPEYYHVNRWYKYLKSNKAFQLAIDTFPDELKQLDNTDNVPKDKVKTADVGKFTDLPGAEIGKVVVRFPPEASGYLHIGHAKAALLNAHYQVNFKGKLILRFDDTNPEKEKEDFEKVILEDVTMLEIKPDLFTFTSDHFDTILEKCELLLKSGVAFADDTDPETMKNEREQRTESKNRNNPVEKNWNIWEEMKKGTDYGKSCCIRAKIDMKSDNGCLRDPTLYRCKSMSHPRTGNKYNVYPTYDFACPLVDSIEGVTHALRTTEYHDRDEQYFWILDALSMRKPYIYEYSRLNMTNTMLSKRKLTWFVEQGIVDGWDDPRMPTVRGILRRGLTVEGLKQFIVAQGSSRSVVVMEWDKIWAFNKKVIDSTAPRYNAVEKENFVPVIVEDAVYQNFKVAKHPKNPELGTKDLYVGPKLLIDKADAEVMNVGENVTFINWGNLLIRDVKRNDVGDVIQVIAKLNTDNKDYKKTLKVTWVIDHPDQKLIQCSCVYYDHLISKAILAKDEDFKNFLNKDTQIVVPMLGDSLLASLKKGDIIQIQRKGFFICDQPCDPDSLRYTSREGPLVLIAIPDGSKDTTCLPLSVRNIRDSQLSEKEKASSLKGKTAEKSPNEESKSFCNEQGDASLETEDALDSKIKIQGDKIRDLKAKKAEKLAIATEVQHLLKLKESYKKITGIDWKPASANAHRPTVKKENSKTSTSALVGSVEICDLDTKIRAQGNVVRLLKSEKGDKNIIDAAVKELLQLKEAFKNCSNVQWKPDLVIEKHEVESETLSITELDKSIGQQGGIVRKLKSEKADKSIIDENVKKLLKFKQDYKSLAGKEWKPEQAAIQPQTAVSNVSVSNLDELIKSQGNAVRKLKSEKADKSIIDENVKKLLKLKEDYKSLAGKEWKPDQTGVQPQTAISNVSVSNLEETSVSPQTYVSNGSVSNLDELIKSQGNIIRKLKSEKADKSIIDENVKKLLKMKEDYKLASGKDWKPEDSKQTASKQSSNPKTQKNVENRNTNAIETESNVKKITRLGLEVKKEDNLADWYSQVLTKGEMIEYYDVSGCYILRPWAYSIWEAIQKFFDSAIKSLGVSNCYFPMFVSSSALEKEKTHISDFAPEVAWVTKSGSSDMDKPIAIRPTSETVMYPSYAKWIRSHRDLPLRLNQWCNVVRWEFRNPQPFIRTREFLWQEGHTAFATKEEAVNEVYTILDIYAQVYEDLLAIPVIKGRKTEKEKFAGADFTTTTEAYVPDNGRGIQGATSHHLGQNFSKMFEIMYEDPESNDKQFVYQNSWGLSTRTIGAMVLIHGDNTGLVIPPRVAACQVVIVPCGITATLKESEKDHLLDKCAEFQSILEKANIAVKADLRDNYSPGWKFNYWELKGVPIRIELGPKDIKKNQFVAVRRDTGEKVTLNMDSAPGSVLELLDNIHDSLYERALKKRDDHLCVTYDWSDFCSKLEKRFIIMSPFCGEIECEENIKKESARNADENLEPGAPSMGAKSLCIPFNQPEDLKPGAKCIHPRCTLKPKYFTLFGRSY